MTTTSEIIKDAYRESNLIGLGATVTDAQNTEALPRLTSLISGVYGFDLGERLEDWMVGYSGQISPDHIWSETDWVYPIANSRVLLNHTTSQTLYLPLTPDNGARIQVIDVNSVLATYNVVVDGNGRLINGAATETLSTDGLNRVYMFDSDVSGWVTVSGLALGDEMPFPTEFDDYFILKLAGRLNPRYGRSLSDLSLARLGEVKEQLEARYRQKRTMPAQRAVLQISDPNRRLSYADRPGKFGWMR